MKQVQLITDGSCLGNPGPGGWAYILRYGKHKKEYVKNGITQWIQNWKRKGWLTGEKKPVLNKELWIELDSLVSSHKATWQWTKGHASHEDNNRCDELASEAARQQICSDRAAKAR